MYMIAQTTDLQTPADEAFSASSPRASSLNPSTIMKACAANATRSLLDLQGGSSVAAGTASLLLKAQSSLDSPELRSQRHDRGK